MRKKIVKAWAVCLDDDGFIPDFNVDGKMEAVMQIHSTIHGAKKLVAKLGGDWMVAPCVIHVSLPTNKKIK